MVRLFRDTLEHTVDECGWRYFMRLKHLLREGGWKYTPHATSITRSVDFIAAAHCMWPSESDSVCLVWSKSTIRLIKDHSGVDLSATNHSATVVAHLLQLVALGICTGKAPPLKSIRDQLDAFGTKEGMRLANFLR